MPVLRFTKMQGLGNDFVVVDATRGAIHAAACANTPARRSALRRRLRSGARRRAGARSGRFPLPHLQRRWRRGRAVRQRRALLRRVRARARADRQARDPRRDRRRPHRSSPRGRRRGDGRHGRAAISTRTSCRSSGGRGAAVEPLDVDGTRVQISAVSMGNPHAVQIVDDIDAAPVATQGPAHRASSAVPAARERGIHAGRRSRYHSPACVRARRRRNARLRHRRLRGSGRGQPPRIARRMRARDHARRRSDDPLAGRLVRRS